MTNNTKAKDDASTKSPSHIVYHLRDCKGEQVFWARIGAAWKHTDGKGFNVQLQVTPLDGRLVLRVASETKD